ncbi:MAG: pilus assembly protein PilP [Pseudomonadales bacterium]|nr:pilus assembly protein PilP [Pseudomonadales bacterium]
MNLHLRKGLSLASILIASQLVGCGSNSYGDLEQYVAEVQARPPGKIKPPPEFKPHATFNYRAAGLRSPFIPPMPEATNFERAGRQVVPEFTRTKEYLEEFRFDALRFVGSIARADSTGQLWALINDGNGGVHRVKEGDFMGKNHGQILGVTTTKVEVVEIVPSGGTDDDGQKLWIERPRTMMLFDAS